VRITIELRRPARRSIVLILATVLLLVPGIALANHQFGDVPQNNLFHDAISNVAGAGITAGFGDGGFHPADPVTRQAMAAFLDRGLGHAGVTTTVDPSAVPVTVNSGETAGEGSPVMSLTIDVPGAPNAFSPVQNVYVYGRVALHDAMSTSLDGCPCEFSAFVFDSAGGQIFGNADTFQTTSTDDFTFTVDVEGLFVAPPGPRTYILGVMLSNRDTSATSASFDLAPTSLLSALTFPFRATD
jgi:hypothetical protein